MTMDVTPICLGSHFLFSSSLPNDWTVPDLGCDLRHPATDLECQPEKSVFTIFFMLFPCNFFLFLSYPFLMADQMSLLPLTRKRFELFFKKINPLFQICFSFFFFFLRDLKNALKQRLPIFLWKIRPTSYGWWRRCIYNLAIIYYWDWLGVIFALQ